MDNKDILINMVSKLDDKLEYIKNNMVTKEECKGKCNDEIRKSEWTVKKVGAYTGLITGSLAGLASFVKLIFYSN